MSERKPRAFVLTADDRFNTTRAEEFGERVYLLPYRITPFNTGDVVSQIRAGVERLQFDPAIDYVCVTGHIISVSIMMAYIGSIAPQGFQVLIFDSRTMSYQVRRLNLGKETIQSS